MKPVVGEEVWWEPRRCRCKVTAVGPLRVFLVPIRTGARTGAAIVTDVIEFEREARPAGQLSLFGDKP